MIYIYIIIYIIYLYLYLQQSKCLKFIKIPRGKKWTVPKRSHKRSQKTILLRDQVPCWKPPGHGRHLGCGAEISCGDVSHSTSENHKISQVSEYFPNCPTQIYKSHQESEFEVDSILTLDMRWYDVLLTSTNRLGFRSWLCLIWGEQL